MAKLRLNDETDTLISGRSPHPFNTPIYLPSNCSVSFILTDFQLIQDPVGCYERFLDKMNRSLLRHPGPVPALDLTALEADFQVHRRTERFIYSVIVSTLWVGTGTSMHYARRVEFDAGLHLLNVIGSDNTQVTTRSLLDH